MVGSKAPGLAPAPWEIAERQLLSRRYARAVERGEVPKVHAWIKLDPDGCYAVYIGSRYHPQSNLRYRFDRDSLDEAHTFAREQVAIKMRKNLLLWDAVLGRGEN